MSIYIHLSICLSITAHVLQYVSLYSLANWSQYALRTLQCFYAASLQKVAHFTVEHNTWLILQGCLILYSYLSFSITGGLNMYLSLQID